VAAGRPDLRLDITHVIVHWLREAFTGAEAGTDATPGAGVRSRGSVAAVEACRNTARVVSAVERLEQIDYAHLAEEQLGAHQVLALDRVPELRSDAAVTNVCSRGVASRAFHWRDGVVVSRC